MYCIRESMGNQWREARRGEIWSVLGTLSTREMWVPHVNNKHKTMYRYVLAHAGLAKKQTNKQTKNEFWHEFVLYFVVADFWLRFFCIINFRFVPFEVRQFKTSCNGLKIDCGSPHGVQLFTECVLRHYILLFYTRFCRLGLQTIDNGFDSGT